MVQEPEIGLVCVYCEVLVLSQVLKGKKKKRTRNSEALCNFCSFPLPYPARPPSLFVQGLMTVHSCVHIVSKIWTSFFLSVLYQSRRNGVAFAFYSVHFAYLCTLLLWRQLPHTYLPSCPLHPVPHCLPLTSYFALESTAWEQSAKREMVKLAHPCKQTVGNIGHFIPAPEIWQSLFSVLSSRTRKTRRVCCVSWGAHTLVWRSSINLLPGFQGMLRFLGSLSEKKAVLWWPRQAGASCSQNLVLGLWMQQCEEWPYLSSQQEMMKCAGRIWLGEGGQTYQPGWKEAGTKQICQVRRLQPASDRNVSDF